MADDLGDDEEFAALLGEFNAVDLEPEDGDLIDSISTNLRKAAGLAPQHGGEMGTTWTAPQFSGLHNSGLAAEEAGASALRRAELGPRPGEVAVEDDLAEPSATSAMWNELTSPERPGVGLKSNPASPDTLARGPRHVTMSDNILAELERLENETRRVARGKRREEAESAAANLDALAAHARAAPRLEPAPLQRVLADVAAFDDDQSLLKLIQTGRKQRKNSREL